ncbi:hypothetical protein [Neobacillus endophyticus]|nr:hypothetical protein [Neobacillus endophyticus]
MGRRRKTPPRIPVEEFSFEYGDVNGIPLVNTKNDLNKTKIKKEK